MLIATTPNIAFVDLSYDELGDYDSLLIYRTLILRSQKFRLILTGNEMSGKATELFGNYSNVSFSGMSGIPIDLHKMEVIILLFYYYFIIFCITYFIILNYITPQYNILFCG
jgi:hypothetical protein